MDKKELEEFKQKELNAIIKNAIEWLVPLSVLGGVFIILSFITGGIVRLVLLSLGMFILLGVIVAFICITIQITNLIKPGRYD